ncbi:MAG TPA: hypothetical protein VH087_15350 [Thermoanaerobaculia bacterium]|jgi:hypothetical protein|nr:hypothetical protein [Thermoanaerobaculia bacterium]
MKRRESLLLAGSAAAALTPKCPLCFFALLGASGAAGAVAAAWMPVVMVVSLVISVAAVSIRSHMEHRYGPAVVALMAALAIAAGKFVMHSAAVVYGGAAALFIAACFHFALERIRWHKPLMW